MGRSSTDSRPTHLETATSLFALIGLIKFRRSPVAALRLRQLYCIAAIYAFLNRPRLPTEHTRFEWNRRRIWRRNLISSKRSRTALARILRTALGAQTAPWLDDESVVEVMLKPDWRLWLVNLRSGREEVGGRKSFARRRRADRSHRRAL